MLGIIGETPISGMDDRVDTCSAAMVSDDILDFSFPQYVESTRTSSSSPQNGKYKIIENYKLDVKFHFFFHVTVDCKCYFFMYS